MYRKLEDFLNEDLTYGEKMEQIKKDMVCLNLTDSKVIHMAKDILSNLFDRNEQKYNDIIEIIKLQNELDSEVGKKERAKFTNLEYLNRKSPSEVSVIKDKWNKIKRSINDEEV